MAENLLFDKLAYIDRLVKAGIDESQARALSDALDEALKESVATRSDITRLEHRIDLAVRDLKIWFASVSASSTGSTPPRRGVYKGSLLPNWKTSIVDGNTLRF